MQPAWQEVGYPQRHYDEIRRADRYARKSIGITGVVFLASLLGAVFGRLPPICAALWGAVFLLFGVLGGLGGVYATRRYVRLTLYFQKPIGDIETFLAGESLARRLSQLDAVAAGHKVTPLSEFGFNDDLCGEQLVWHAANDGLRTVAALLTALEQQQTSGAADLVSDLRKWLTALKKAAFAEVPFCVLLMHGNSTSGREWAVRKGSAF